MEFINSILCTLVGIYTDFYTTLLADLTAALGPFGELAAPVLADVEAVLAGVVAGISC